MRPNNFTREMARTKLETMRVERKWRVGAPTVGVSGSLYDFVRRYLFAQGGSCSRDQLHSAILGEPILKARLEHGRGIGALLSNMRHSGEIVFDGDLVRASSRAVRRIMAHAQQRD